MNQKNPKGFHPHTFKTLIKNPIHFLAFGLGSGLLHPAPGTWGTMGGLILFYPLSFFLKNSVIMALFLLIAFVIGCWLCDRTTKDIGVHDFSEIVWDEFVGIWLVLAYFPTSIKQSWGLFPSYLTAFLLFRFFDILKPQPIKWIDKYVPGGFGIMVDDILASGYALLVLWLLSAIL